jgi:hypothetical protein
MFLPLVLRKKEYSSLLHLCHLFFACWAHQVINVFAFYEYNWMLNICMLIVAALFHKRRV